MDNSDRNYLSKFTVVHDSKFSDLEDFDDFYSEDDDEVDKLMDKINLNVDDDFLFE